MLSLILPTYNEAANITSLLETVDGVLQHIPHEIIVVDDDSPDGTWQVAMETAKRRPAVKVLRRRGKKGLSSAVVDGFDAAHGQILAVMDADGQHDATLLLRLVSAIQSGADIAIGSRYVEGGSVGDWVADRRIISSTGTFFAQRLSQVPVSDPLGGFFAIKKELYKRIRPRLKPSGFKILLEILAAVPPTSRLVEVPLIFRMRLHGESKLSMRVHWAFAMQVLRLSLSQALHSGALLGGSLFTVLTVGAAVLIAPRIVVMLPILLNPELRSRVQSTLEQVAAKEGWLVSDIRIDKVTRQSMTITHHQHSRVSEPTEHCTVDLGTSNLTCAR